MFLPSVEIEYDCLIMSKADVDLHNMEYATYTFVTV